MHCIIGNWGWAGIQHIIGMARDTDTKKSEVFLLLLTRAQFTLTWTMGWTGIWDHHHHILRSFVFFSFSEVLDLDTPTFCLYPGDTPFLCFGSRVLPRRHLAWACLFCLFAFGLAPWALI